MTERKIGNESKVPQPEDDESDIEIIRVDPPPPPSPAFSTTERESSGGESPPRRMMSMRPPPPPSNNIPRTQSFYGRLFHAMQESPVTAIVTAIIFFACIIITNMIPYLFAPNKCASTGNGGGGGVVGEGGNETSEQLLEAKKKLMGALFKVFGF